MEYTTGEYIHFVIESRDQFSNLRTDSISDVYTVTLTGEQSNTEWTAATPTPNRNGTYSASFKFTIAESYTLKVKLGSTQVMDSPIEGIMVHVGQAQARYSQLVHSESPLVAGRNYTFKI